MFVALRLYRLSKHTLKIYLDIYIVPHIRGGLSDGVPDTLMLLGSFIASAAQGYVCLLDTIKPFVEESQFCLGFKQL